jgi:voltage-gated potassium channel
LTQDKPASKPDHFLVDAQARAQTLVMIRDSSGEPHLGEWPGRWRRRLLSMWPQWPMAIMLIATGVVNLLVGIRYHSSLLAQFKTLSTVGQSLSILGSRTQTFLGAGLMLVGFGLLWRLAVAWAFGVLLLAMTVGVDIFQGQRGAVIILPAIMLLALVIFRRHFTRRTVWASYLISMTGVLAILVYGTVGSYMLGKGFHPEIKDVTSALYFTIITLSTVGYGDITPAVPEARLFVVTLIVVGLSVFATAIASTLGPLISGELRHMLTPGEKRMKKKGHVIVVGEGPIARNTAHELEMRGIPFVQVVVQEGETLLPEKALAKGGEASEDSILREADIDTARMLVAAGDDDGENAFISLVAKDLNPDITVLAVASSARSIRRLKLARADVVFASAAVGSRLLANLIEGNAIPSEFRDLLEGDLRET